MKPIKSLQPLSVWLMRIGLLLFAYDQYFNTFTKFKLDNINFYVAALFLIFSAIIFITGFICRTTLTVISGLVISLISIYNIIDVIDSGLDSFLVINIIIASIAIYFLSNPSCK